MFAIDDLIQVKVFFGFEETPYDRTLNVFHYRCSAGGGSDNLATDYNAIFDAFTGTVTDPMLQNMTTKTNMFQIRIQKILPTVEWEFVKDYAPGEAPGSLTDLTDTAAQSAAACFIRRSYVAGRKGIGRTFFGPLFGAFRNGDKLVIDPTLSGDLNDVTTAFTAILAPADTGSWKPNIYGPVGTDTGITLAQRDQRTANWSPLVSTLRTRKPGRGS